MREVFVHKEYARVGHYQSVLEAAGISTFIRNGHSHNIISELPIPALDPVLCVMDDADYERATELIRSVHKPEPNDGPDWTCPDCQESVPATFDSCWKCGVSPTDAKSQSAEVAAPVAAPVSSSERERYEKAVAFLRLLIVLGFLMRFVWLFVGTSVYQRLDIYPENFLTPFDRIFGTFGVVFECVCLALCFFFNRVGRAGFLFSLVVGLLMAFGTTGGVLYRPAAALMGLWAPLNGALLAMMFFSPAAVYFEKKYQQR